MEVFRKFSEFGRGSLPLAAVHPVSRVTLLVSGGKFAGGLDFSGGRCFSFRGALYFVQGGAYFLSGGTFLPVKNARLNSGGPKPP